MRRSDRPLPSLLALALGGFAIGTTEFASLGLLSAYSHGLHVSVPTAGIAVSAYALGVVVGAPLIAILAASWPRRRLVLVLAGTVLATNAASAAAPSFGTFVLARFLAGLPHGAYFGVAAVVAAGLVPYERRPRAVAVTASGLMVANVVGVPAVTGLGQAVGWRFAYVAVAAVAGLATLAIAVLVPATPAGGSIRTELAALRSRQVWLTLAVVAVGFGGMFALYSYLGPILHHEAGLPLSRLPLVLAAYGLGMVVGNAVGGRLAERAPLPTIVVGMAAITVTNLVFTVTVRSVLGAALTLFVLAVAVISTTPALTLRLMDAAAGGPSLAAAMYHSAFNVANAVGAALGGVVLAAGLGYTAPILVSAATPVLGLVVLAVAVRVTDPGAVAPAGRSG